MYYIVTAYKDHYGKLHETAEACQKANGEHKRRLILSRAESVFVATLRPQMDKDYRYGVNGVSPSYVYMVFSRDWKRIRDALNLIEE